MRQVAIDRAKTGKLSPQEETLFLSLVTLKIMRFAEGLNCSRKVKATAMMYFKRFFLFSSILEYDTTEVFLELLVFILHVK